MMPDLKIKPEIFVGFILLVLSTSVAIAQERPDALVADLLSLKTSTQIEADKVALETQLATFIRHQRNQWNQASSIAWAGIGTRAGWETFRKEKLANLAESVALRRGG